jgi:hypothetical protein
MGKNQQVKKIKEKHDSRLPKRAAAPRGSSSSSGVTAAQLQAVAEGATAAVLELAQRLCVLDWLLLFLLLVVVCHLVDDSI